MKVFIAPRFPGPDKGEGGIRRVVEAQRRWLPKYGFDVTDNLVEADIVALHAGEWVDPHKAFLCKSCHVFWNDYTWLAGRSG